MQIVYFLIASCFSLFFSSFNVLSNEDTHAKVFLSKPETRRIIYFTGHKDHPKSALITQVCKDFETFSALLRGECATRTLANLYNLHAVRGVVNSDSELCFQTSMSGPHHYFGWLNPKEQHSIEFEDGLPIFRTHSMPQAAISKKLVPESSILKIADYHWMSGKDLDEEALKLYSVGNTLATSLIDTDSGKFDSLFDDPGILALGTDELTFNILHNAHLYDLSPYHAQIVPNDTPFSFNQELVAEYKHAQHKLRVVTYNYGDNYLSDYLMRGSGVFIERHEFIQAITPMNEQCGGFVLLGRETGTLEEQVLELIAVTVPFGYTLLVDVGSIHGDSTLTGLHMMAMTGNHHAMKTADTVFLKNYTTRKNVSIKTKPELKPVAGLLGSEFFLTSDEKSLKDLIANDLKIKADIKNSLSPFAAFWWRPVIMTGTSAIGWAKTLGSCLPKVNLLQKK